MAKSYSMDLRERVVAVVAGGGSRRKAAARFGVAASTAIGWVKRVDRTGSAAPAKPGQRQDGKIQGEHRDWLIARCKPGSFTLRGLVAELAQRALKVDYKTVWKFVHAENLSFKKKPSGQRARSRGCGAPPPAMATLSGTD
jgi:transposase